MRREGLGEGGETDRGRSDRHQRSKEFVLGGAPGHDTQVSIMRLALAARHRVERPAISMEGGMEKPMERLPAAVCFAYENVPNVSKN